MRKALHLLSGYVVLAATFTPKKADWMCKEDFFASCNPSTSTILPTYPIGSEYERIDKKLIESPKFDSFRKGHALHDTLAGDRMIEAYEVYKHKTAEEIMCLVKFGETLNGHRGIVHGGITALVFDNSFGWLFICLEKPMAVTANLNINYRSPLKANTIAVLKAKIDKTDGRKMFMSASLEDLEGKLIADSRYVHFTCLCDLISTLHLTNATWNILTHLTFHKIIVHFSLLSKCRGISHTQRNSSPK